MAEIDVEPLGWRIVRLKLLAGGKTIDVVELRLSAFGQRQAVENRWRKDLGVSSLESRRLFHELWLELEEPTPPQAGPLLPTLDLRPAREAVLREEGTRWIWRPWLAAGGVALLQARDHSLRRCLLSAIVRQAQRAERRDSADGGSSTITVLSADENWDDQWVSSFRAHRVDLARVDFAGRVRAGGHDRILSLPEDLPLFENRLPPDVRLIVVDPLAAWIDPGLQEHRPPHMLQVFLALSGLARRTAAAVVATIGDRAADCGLPSAILRVARSRDLWHGKRTWRLRLLSSPSGQRPKPLSFRIVNASKDQSACVQWLDDRRNG